MIEDLNNGAQKPCRSSSPAPTRVSCWPHQPFHEQLRQVRVRRHVGLSEQDPQSQLKIELDRGLAIHSAFRPASSAGSAGAFAGVEAGGWIDPIGENRDVAVRLHPDDRAMPATSSAADRRRRQQPDGSAGTDRDGHDGTRAVADQHFDGKRTIAVAANAQGRSPGEVDRRCDEAARAMQYPPGYGLRWPRVAWISRRCSRKWRCVDIGHRPYVLILVMPVGSFTAHWQ